MNDPLYKILKNSDPETPQVLHARVMKAVSYSQLARQIATLSVLIAISFVWSVWYLYAKIIELDFITTVRAAVSTLEFDIDSIRESLSFTLGLAPLSAFAFVLMNCLAFWLLARANRVLRERLLSLA